MDFALLLAIGALAAVLLVLLVLMVSARRRLDRQLVATRADLDAVRARLDEVSVDRAAQHQPLPAEYLITSAGTHLPAETCATTVPTGAVLSAAFGEPLVKIVAFGYGVRRALSARSRNRIRFEMRREVRRARKQRLRSRRSSSTATRDAA